MKHWLDDIPSKESNGVGARMALTFWLIAAAVTLRPEAVFAADMERLQCPPKVELASGVLTPGSWEAPFTPLVKDAVLWLSGASAYHGPPAQLATLVPHEVKTAGKTERITWRFEGEYAQGKWLTCDYGNGAARLQVRVDDKVSSCTAMSRHYEPPAGLTIAFTCR